MDITHVLRQYAAHILEELEALAGQTFAPVPDDVLIISATAMRITAIAMVAGGDMPHDSAGVREALVLAEVEGLLRRLFWSPGMREDEPVVVPSAFWPTELGKTVARAVLWAKAGDLITMQEAADLRGVGLTAISNAVARGALQRFVNPDAPRRQGHILVSRDEVRASME